MGERVEIVLERQLHHGHVGVGIDGEQRRKRAVVETSVVIERGRMAGPVEQRLGPLGQGR